MQRTVFIIIICTFQISCRVSKVYDLDTVRIPYPVQGTVEQLKWDDFDSLFLTKYLPINWKKNKYLVKRHIVVLRTTNKNHKKFNFFFNEYWKCDIKPATY